mmetsp:Transcript_31388/g.47452  ORF Transcript_31388/g.47452 Transcript_31388/m.47452 type:complete len:233 (+) Transcript_31388:108-806(+)
MAVIRIPHVCYDLWLILSLLFSVDSLSPVARRNFIQTSSNVATASFLSTAFPANAAYIDPNTDLPKITDRVYIDVQLSTGEEGRIEMGLFGELLPRVTENFVALCKSNKYAGTTFYRVISDLTIQGGAIGDDTGKTGISSFGNTFEPDNFNVKHNRAGLVSMVRATNGGVDSRFFINTVEDGGWGDDRYAAFGIVEDETSMKFVHAIEKVKVKPPQNNPKEPVRITASGVLN